MHPRFELHPYTKQSIITIISNVKLIIARREQYDDIEDRDTGSVNADEEDVKSKHQLNLLTFLPLHGRRRRPSPKKLALDLSITTILKHTFHSTLDPRWCPTSLSFPYQQTTWLTKTQKHEWVVLRDWLDATKHVKLQFLSPTKKWKLAGRTNPWRPLET